MASRLTAAGLFARTVSIKVRLPDFSTFTRSRTLLTATDRSEVIGTVATSLLSAVNVAGGVRLLGVGVAGLTDVLQEDLFAEDTEAAAAPTADVVVQEVTDAATRPVWRPGLDVAHDEQGRGWVWGCGWPGDGPFRDPGHPTGPGPYLLGRRPRPLPVEPD